jgi:hypothetical protein
MDPAADDFMISLRGCIGEGLMDAFSPLLATIDVGRTILRGRIEDQAALHGVLARIQYLGLELEEIRRLPTGVIGGDGVAPDSH